MKNNPVPEINLRHSKGFTHIWDHVGGVYYFTIELMGLLGKSRTNWQFRLANCNSLPEDNGSI